MANYNLVIDSQFKPFSYQELIAPAMMATQAHEQIQDTYADLATKSSVWDNMANKETDPRAHALYQSYSEDLASKAEDLAKNGLTPSSRQDMSNLRARYSKNIIPIENAYNRRSSLADEQRKILASNPSMLFQKDASTMSLDDFLANPNADYGKSYSGALLTQQVAGAASNLAREARSNPNSNQLKKLLPYTYEYIKRTGFDSNEIMKAIAGSPDANKILSGIVNTAVGTSGVNDWGDNSTKKVALQYAKEGLWSALGQTTSNMVTDQAGLATLQSNLEEGRQIRAENRADIRAKAAATSNALAADGNIPMDVNYLLSPGQENLSKIKGVAKSTADILGLSTTTGKYAKESGHIISKVLPSASRGSNQFTRGDIGTATYNAKNANGSNKFSWFTGSGNLISKNAFLKQGASAKDKQILSAQYDKVFSDIKANVPAVNHRWSASTIAKGFKAAIVGNGPMKLGVLALKFKDNRGVLENIIPTLTNSNNEVPIREVANYDATGKIKYTSKIYHADDFVDSKGKAISAPAYFAAPNPKTDGILMKLNGKTYSIPLNKLGSLYKDAQQLDIPRLTQAQQFKNAAIQKVGQDNYYKSKAGSYNESVLNNSGASFIKTMYNALDWSAESPVYKVNTTSDSQNQ